MCKDESCEPESGRNDHDWYCAATNETIQSAEFSRLDHDKTVSVLMRTKRPLLCIVDRFRNEQGQSDRTKETDRLSFDTSIGHVFPFYSSRVPYSYVLWRLMSLVYTYDIHWYRWQIKHTIKGSVETKHHKSIAHRQNWHEKKRHCSQTEANIYSNLQRCKK
jgi:hypothetical protein